MRNFSGTEFANKAVGFDEPTQLPRDDAQRRQWQSANKTWWESTPMRYDWRDEITASPGTEAYFIEIDRRFLSSAREYMPWRNLPFEQVIPFDEIRDKDVLEIGVGQGTHAQLLAPHCRSFTGIDLTSPAVEMTARRLQLFNIQGKVLQMDAEHMSFEDSSYDYIWSWGVIHHSADTRRVLEEMHRVLRPGGKCTVMIYYRSWWHFYVCGFLRGVFQNQFQKQRNLHDVAQGATDGAIARHYTVSEWRRSVDGLFTVESAQIYGLKAQIVPLPHGRPKMFLESLIPNSVARLLTNQLRMGSFLLAHMRRNESKPSKPTAPRLAG
jgi:ubiquinone/menaquinone biosynthesis C-methylase UbiE